MNVASRSRTAPGRTSRRGAIRRALGGLSVCLYALVAGPGTMHSEEPPRSAERLLAESRPLVIAHRGYNAVAPENTVPAFHLALEAGADLVELDYHHSREGVPIVIHDAELDRTTDAAERFGAKKVRVDQREIRELELLDAGRWYHPAFTGTRLPRLDEALTLIQQRGVTLIERKGGDAATCLGLLRQQDLINRVVVQSFDWEYLRDFHRREPQQILGALGPPGSAGGRKLTEAEKELNATWLEKVAGLGARLVVWNRQVTRDAIRQAHERQLKVWVYTINDPALANHLLDLGVDGLITDNPALMWRTLALRR